MRVRSVRLESKRIWYATCATPRHVRVMSESCPSHIRVIPETRSRPARARRSSAPLRTAMQGRAREPVRSSRNAEGGGGGDLRDAGIGRHPLSAATTHYTHTQTHTHTNTHTHKHTHTHTHTHTHLGAELVEGLGGDAAAECDGRDAPRLCVCVRACVRECVRTSACLRACVRACMRACMRVHERVRACLHACARARVRACMCISVCVRACARACVRVPSGQDAARLWRATPSQRQNQVRQHSRSSAQRRAGPTSRTLTGV